MHNNPTKTEGWQLAWHIHTGAQVSFTKVPSCHQKHTNRMFVLTAKRRINSVEVMPACQNCVWFNPEVEPWHRAHVCTWPQTTWSGAAAQTSPQVHNRADRREMRMYESVKTTHMHVSSERHTLLLSSSGTRLAAVPHIPARAPAFRCWLHPSEVALF